MRPNFTNPMRLPILALLALPLAAQQVKLPTDVPHAQHFTGAWRLISAEYVAPSGNVRYIYGRGAVGTLIYDGRGHMSAQIMNPDREAHAANDRLKAAPEEAMASFRTYLAYFGDYTVDEKKQVVIHRVKGSLLPNWTGTDQVRRFEFWGNDRLILSADTTLEGIAYKAKLTWERLR